MGKEILMKDIYFLDDNDTILKKAKKIFEKETGLKIEGFKSKEINSVLCKAPDVIIIDEKSIAKPRGFKNANSCYIFI